MKNKEITIYELMGLIKDNKAPKEIRIDNKIWYLYKSNKGISYIDNEKTYLKSCSLNFNYYIEENKLNDTVEILPEENKMVEMKEMVYQKDRKTELLYSGTYKGYDFYIINLGTHPTAYVNVCNNKLLNGKEYDKIDIDVHGGLTYSEDHLYINAIKEVKGWFIGWDYAHYNDYAGYEMDMPENLRSNGEKWTTEEIFEDVKGVIEQCINYQENDEWEDIEELQEEGNFKFYNKPTGMSEEVAKILDAYLETLIIKINSLIKNQRYLKEKLEEK